MSNNKSNILPIVVMFLLFFMIAFVTNFAGSMGVIVKTQFGASNAMAQLGTLANFIAYAVMGVPAGIILKRKGYKFTSLLAVSVGFVGVGIQWLSGYAESFGVYVLGAFVAGFSMCLLNIVVNPMLNTLGGGGKRGNQLIQFGGSCNSIGGTLAPIILGYLIGGSAAAAQVGDAAPAMLAAMLIFLVAFVIISLTKIPEPHIETPEQRAAAKANKDQYSPLSFRHFVLGAIAIFFYVGVEVGIPNTANLYMSNNPAVGPAIAGTVVGLYWLMMMCGRLLGGAIGGKVSSKAMLVAVSSLAIVMLLCVMFFPETWVVAFKGIELPVSMIIMFLCGLMTSVMWGAIFNLAAEGLGKYTPAASGIFMALVCGGGILPFFQNLLADHTNYLISYIVPIAGLLYILFYALIGSKNVNKDIPTE
ncbi:MAG: MFS transporter [Paludibacteraceae bacterium]|nr:MFS transporter [Paludibacteraceae bacterium]MBQ2438294.1 MFS transporter [Paludibacteraceae bacterium]MBQ9752633.1 MFS transporter [Paludibacteraceae bacterium]